MTTATARRPRSAAGIGRTRVPLRAVYFVLLGLLYLPIGLLIVFSFAENTVLIFPIAAATAAESGLNFRPFVMAIVIGASCSFLTPIGYQTNLLVFGMGNYKFRDFTRLGAPLTLATIIVSLIVIPIAYPLT